MRLTQDFKKLIAFLVLILFTISICNGVRVVRRRVAPPAGAWRARTGTGGPFDRMRRIPGPGLMQPRSLERGFWSWPFSSWFSGGNRYPPPPGPMGPGGYGGPMLPPPGIGVPPPGVGVPPGMGMGGGILTSVDEDCDIWEDEVTGESYESCVIYENYV